MSKYVWSVIIITLVLVGQFTDIHQMYVFSPTYHFIMHVMGGLGFGLLASAFLDTSGWGQKKKSIIIVASALGAGLVWEILEVCFEVTGLVVWSRIYVISTLVDLLNDIIGGAIVAYIDFRIWLKKQK